MSTVVYRGNKGAFDFPIWDLKKRKFPRIIQVYERKFSDTFDERVYLSQLSSRSLKMKCVLFLYSGSDSAKAEQLKDYLQGKLRKVADLRNITDILAEEQDFKKELSRSSCVVLTGSRHASSLIQNQRQETENDFITFDGKVIHDAFTGNKELLDRLVIVFFTERNKNDWIPTGLNESRIFNLQGEEIQRGNPSLDHLEDCIKGILTGKTRV